MTASLDIYRTANVLVKEYGPEQAALMVARQSDALLSLGDIADSECGKRSCGRCTSWAVASIYGVMPT
jgi:hypothetical protein